MQMNLLLNNNTIRFEGENGETLLSALRRQHITSVKCGCSKGMCGSCTVLIDNKAVPSCLVPIESLTNRKILTLEIFALTNEYDDIMQGLKRANVKLCGFCDTGKIFAIHEILIFDENPNRNDVLRRMRTFSCTCTSVEAMTDAVFKAFDIYTERTGKSEYGRK